MSDSYNNPQKNSRNFDGSQENGISRRFRGGQGPGNKNREGGGFRIRLSDNEMRSANSLQEAFNLRSTVAVLGFALRTLGQMLEEGKLDELITQYRSEGPQSTNKRGPNDRGRLNNDHKNKNSRPNPFERPSKPEQSSSTEGTSAEQNDELAPVDPSEVEEKKTISEVVNQSQEGSEKEANPIEN